MKAEGLETIALEGEALRIAVVPGLGGGLARFDRRIGDRWEPVFRSWDGSADPNALACYPLVPWSNRIGRGGIDLDGRFWPIAPTVPGEPFPLHGEGWRAAWRVAEQAPQRVELTFESRAIPPFDYAARLSYAVEREALRISLAVEHRGETACLYGLGLHPWLPRSAATTLEARATQVWLEDARHLPTDKVRVAEVPDWDFRHRRHLPPRWINNAFVAWDGFARITWPDRGLALGIEADAWLGTFILYAPGAEADFFCFEPVSHPVDAFALPERDGLVRLGRGESVSVSTRFVTRVI